MDEERFKMCNNCVFLNGRKDDYNAESKLSPECGLASAEINLGVFDMSTYNLFIQLILISSIIGENTAEMFNHDNSKTHKFLITEQKLREIE